MVATAVTLNDLEGHSPVAGVFTCNPSSTCAAFYAAAPLADKSADLSASGAAALHDFN